MKELARLEKIRLNLKDISEKLRLSDVVLSVWNPKDNMGNRYRIHGNYKTRYNDKVGFETDYLNSKELDAVYHSLQAMIRFNEGLNPEKHLTIIGRRWFEKINGNTYHSVVVYINGQCVGGVDFEYGYDDQYIQTAQDILEKLGYPSETYPNGNKAYGRPYFEKHFTSWIANVSNVERKKDL
jgi:hypothetical protein